MSRLDPLVDHLLRRAGFGASPVDVETFRDLSFGQAVAYLVDYENRPDDVDARIGRPDHAQVASRDIFSPDTDINEARQRWLFRMIHARRPLQEKMALFWHNHFATAYTKLAADSGALQAAKMMALKPGTVRGPRGQIELFRQYALGSFRNLLIEVARDPAMLVWLDGQSNTRQKPQENFGREVMELFTVGVGHHTEPDVYAAARVFTGWNLRRSEGYRREDVNSYREFVYNGEQHDTDAKTFSFPIDANGGRTIPERSERDGMRDGIDLLTALALHPETARRLARKFWSVFVSEVYAPDPAFIEAVADVYRRHDTRIAPVVHYILTSPWFTDPSTRYTRYSWPPEFVVRAVKEVGWQGLSLNTVLAPLANMGLQLFEPPDVGGWPLGTGWFSTGTMLARANFAATVASNQRAYLVASLDDDERTSQALPGAMLDRLTPAPLDPVPRQALGSYVQAIGSASGSAAQLDARAAGLARLIVGSSEYQLV
ncbi:MAG: DUF1800 domain-containing protein [Acidobacteria bacterium]|nr:DUF1800 domain-containing protein [Acidobacteriota bacterium]